MSEHSSILLKGLDGSNPLAFLAALGALRTLSLALPAERVRMNWEECDGAWRPRVWCSLASDADAIIEKLDGALARSRSSHATRFIDYKSSNEDAVAFYQSVRDGGAIEPEFDAWISALTNDVHPDATSPLQLTRSDYFVGNLDQILISTSSDHLRRSLMLPWKYDDALSGQSLHLDPTEDRRHAYQWNRPSGDPNRNRSGNVLGANRLAVEALPYFLGLPSSNPAKLLLTGWTGVRADDSQWTWPIWEPPVTVAVVRSTLALAGFQAIELKRDQLVPAGVVAAYRCRRILVEKTPNLTPAIGLL